LAFISTRNFSYQEEVLNKKRRQKAYRPWGIRGLRDRRRLAQMFFFHRHTAACAANKFHGSQLVLAHVLGIRFGSSAESAFGFIATGVAQVSGFVGNRAAIPTGIGHGILLSE
jgi:hypothetical protein